jgi:two-component system sensor histidine kinase MprB
VDRFERRPDAPTFVVELEETVARVDAERISRAISNLLANAVKWSPPGGRVDVVLRDRTLTVHDSGPGFLEEDLPHVFERFYRAASARSKPGSGLGLAIVRQAVETAGGTVAAENAPGGGALVRVALPTT